MLDIRFIRENQELVQQNALNKGYKIDVGKLIQLDDKIKDIKRESDNLRERRNKIASLLKSGQLDQHLIDEGKQIKSDISKLESNLDELEVEFQLIISNVPNIIQHDVPLGGEDDSVEIKKWGENKVEALDHLELALSRDWIDFERGAKVAGNKFYYLKGDLALLENAIYQFALNFVIEKGFKFMTVPHMVSSRILTGTGFSPRTSEQSDEYGIEGEDLSLIATAEIPLTGYHSDEIIAEDNLPLLYAGYSPCYRKEAGAYGKYARGLFRVHQFNKLELYAYTLPEKSSEMHERILAFEEEIWQLLKIPYRVVNIAAGDLGSPAAKKYDIEYWSPVDKKYRELTSCSNCTDYQTRNLNIRLKRQDGTIEMLHSLNGTAVSLARSLVAILENYQTDDNKILVPDVLRPYLSNRELL
ncbi:MAG: serine--tRNA ligase [Candidatus Saccharimonadales bacterium]